MRTMISLPVLAAALWCGGVAAVRAQCADPTLAGRVTVDGEPAAGAVVAVYWAARDSTFQVFHLDTDDDGAFRRCGHLPAGQILVRAHRGEVASAPWRLGPYAGTTLRVELPLDRPVVPIVPGYVTDASTNRPVEGALVRVRGADGWDISQKDGSFMLHDVEVGVRTLVVSHLAFGALSREFFVRATENQLISVKVDPEPLVLQPLSVTVARRFTTPGMAAFYDRKEKGSGYFVGREDIERNRPSNMMDLMRAVPGLRYYCERGECGIYADRANSCDVRLFVDGTPWDIRALDVFSPKDIEGVEVYLHVGQIPSRYRGAGAECGVVGIWLRPRRP